MKEAYYLTLLFGIMFVWILPTTAKSRKRKYPFLFFTPWRILIFP
jgi:hypothetical protein